MTRWLLALLAALSFAPMAQAVDEADLLPIDEAFALTATASERGRIELHWEIADGYYLYRHRMGAEVLSPGFKVNPLELPDGIAYTDEFFGDVETYRDAVTGVLTGAAADGTTVEVRVSPDSERLQLLEPFAPWDGEALVALPVLVKAMGKCTTDHISAAGPWLRYRGHLENISGNLFLGAVNAFTGEAGSGKDQLDGQTKPYPDIARHYHEAGQAWVAVGDENYGEGSSREHAAMEPRFRGCAAVLVRSFARIAETNLKKQGVLPLTFVDPATYDAIGEDDRISVLGLADLAPDQRVQGQIVHADGSTTDFEVEHTMNDEQIAWFRAGGALNVIRQELGAG